MLLSGRSLGSETHNLGNGHLFDRDHFVDNTSHTILYVLKQLQYNEPTEF
jgi:hypothetical protein